MFHSRVGPQKYFGAVYSGVELVWMVQLEHPDTDVATDHLGGRIVFGFPQTTDRARKHQVAYADEGRTSPREISPRELTIIVNAGNDVLEDAWGVDAEVQGVTAVPECGPELAHGVGDVPIALRPPTDDEPDEAVRVVPVDRASHVGDGETKALVILDQLGSGPFVHRGT